jgi:hypothetical protein
VADQPDTNRQIARVASELDRPADAAQETPLSPDIPPDRTRKFRTVNFSRMRTRWPKEDGIVIAEIQAQVTRELDDRFKQALDVRNRIWLCVRLPLLRNGEPVLGTYGYPQWECHPNGVPVEDWSQLTDRQRDDFIHEISIWMYEWELAGVELWSQAMYAKGKWEETFAIGYLAPQGRLTIDDRTQEGTYASVEERYHAIYLSTLSRGADAIIRSMKLLVSTLENTRR